MLNNYSVLEVLEGWVNQEKSEIFKTILINVSTPVDYSILLNIEDFNSILKGVYTINKNKLSKVELCILHEILSNLGAIHILINKKHYTKTQLNNLLDKYFYDLYLDVNDLKAIHKSLMELEKLYLDDSDDLPF